MAPAPVSMAGAVNKAFGVTKSFDVGEAIKCGCSYRLRKMAVTASEIFTLIVGANNNEKLKHCMDRFMPILDGLSIFPFLHYPSPYILR